MSTSTSYVDNARELNYCSDHGELLASAYNRKLMPQSKQKIRQIWETTKYNCYLNVTIRLWKTMLSRESMHCNLLQKTAFWWPSLARSYSHTRLTALCPGLPRWAGTRKAKPTWILLKQETVSGSGISWAICRSAPRSRQITTPAPHHSVFTGRMPFLPPNQQHQSIEGQSYS